MSIPGYDAWKLATPPEYDITPEQEMEMEDEERRLRLLCVECGEYPSDPPSKLCPACEAYQEHQR